MPTLPRLDFPLRTSLPLECKTLGDDESGVFEGIAASFGTVDSYGEVCERGCFTKTLQQRQPVCLWAHNQAEVIGRWTHLAENDVGLRATGQLNLKVGRAREIHALMKDRSVGGLSIGFRVAPGGRELASDGLTATLKQVELYEISVVAIPANDSARVESVKSAFSSRDELEEILCRSLPLRAARKLLDQGWSAFDGTPEPDPEDPAWRALTEAVKAARLDLKSLKKGR